MRSPLTAVVLAAGLVAGAASFAADKPADAPAESPEKPETLDTKWHVLVNPARRARGQRPLPKNGPLANLPKLELTGPAPGHPFILGHYADDGKWGFVDGSLALVEGRNASVKLAHAENFELEGVIEMGNEGGWFLLLGWDEGHGYSIINIGFRESPSPWFITEYRGDAAIAEAHQEVAKHAWRKDQVLNLSVKDQVLNLHVGKVAVLKEQTLPNYSEGDIILGVYDTKYGPRPVRVHSLRIRNVE
jgi:hypothetical protein